MTLKLLGIVGFKNAGKTTLTERLVSELTARRYRISTVKHAHHAFDIDQEGRDSWRHRQAGARNVAGGALKVSKLAPCDLVLTEGYKWEKHPKIEVRNVTLAHPELAGKDSTVIAIAANGVIETSPVPVFDRENVKSIADFIVAHMELARP